MRRRQAHKRRPSRVGLRSRVALATLSVCILVTGLAVAQGQDPALQALAFSDVAQRNASAMMQYTWKMSVRVTVDGTARPERLYHMRYDSQGTLHKTPLSEPQDSKKRGVRGQVEKKKQKAAKEYAALIAELVRNYSSPSTGTLVDFFQQAPVIPRPDGTIEIKGTGFLAQGDTVSYVIDPRTNELRTFSFWTVMDGDRVRGETHFDRLSNGLSYAARTTIEFEAKKYIVAVAENFDHLRQGG
ncbi:MAG: hypothetical protein WBG93_00405 [Thermoanaerobaculia bacterium]